MALPFGLGFWRLFNKFNNIIYTGPKRKIDNEPTPLRRNNSSANPCSTLQTLILSVVDVIVTLCRRDTYENTWMYYVELSVKGSHKFLGIYLHLDLMYFQIAFSISITNLCFPTWFRKKSSVETNKRVRFEETGLGGMDLPDQMDCGEEGGWPSTLAECFCLQV